MNRGEGQSNLDFLSSLIANMNTSITEKGAVGYKTTSNPLADVLFKIPSYRHDKENFLVDFQQALNFDPVYAIKFLFYLRDVRGGVGERSTFREGLLLLAKAYPYALLKVIELIPFYGRWDDMFVLLRRKNENLDERENKVQNEIEQKVISIIREQLHFDLIQMSEGEPVSLLAKWLPSENTSSQETRKLARYIRKKMGLTAPHYRLMLSEMRAYLNIVERQMSKGEWNKIDYSAVPSRANMIYKNAFIKHDKDRRTNFINDVLENKNSAKVNAKTLFPHEIIKQIRKSVSTQDEKEIKAQWQGLPDLMPLKGSVLVVGDSSGSMTWGQGSVLPIDVAAALSIYCAERLEEPYKDKFITFSDTPSFVDLSSSEDIISKYEQFYLSDWGGTTNIEAVFDLVLKTAIENGVLQSELPDTILVISDMEFDLAWYVRNESCFDSRDRLFDTIRKKYKQYGYELPHLVFWNVSSRTNTIPDFGKEVTLIGGYTPQLLKVALNPKGDNWEQLKAVLDGSRYTSVDTVLNNFNF